MKEETLLIIPQLEGLNEYVVLENYIPVAMLGIKRNLKGVKTKDENGTNE